MKKTLAIILLTLFAVSMKAQTCSSPISLDDLNGSFLPIDSFSVNSIFFKFKAQKTYHRLKFYVKDYSALGNYFIRFYGDDCSSIPSNSVVATANVSNDSVFFTETFLEGRDYLIELGKVSSNTVTVVYTVFLDNERIAASWGCPIGSSCPGDLPCEYICNGGFEQVSSIPIQVSQLSNANNWDFGTTQGSSDLISSQAGSSTGVNSSCNIGGGESPHTGICSTNNNYAHIQTWSDYFSSPPSDYSEYIQTKFTSSLSPGTYVLTFYLSKGEHSNGNLQSLGIWLTSNPLNYPTSGAIPTTPNITITNTVTLNSTTSGWTEVKICFYASGGENYLTIGRPPGALVTLGSAPTNTCSHYFNFGSTIGVHNLYIDDVSVKPFKVQTSPSTYSLDVCGSVNITSSLTCGNAGLGSIIYSWSGNGLSNPSIPNPVATINSSSAYNLSVYGTDSQGNQCSTSDGFVVMSNTLNPLVLTPSASTVCPGANFTITPSLSGGTGSYTMQPGNIVGSSFVASIFSNTSYTISGTGAAPNSCVQIKVITINIFNDVLNASAQPAAICVGETSTLSATGSVAGYTWTPGNFTSNPLTVQPLFTTNYTVTGISSNGCIAKGYVTVTVNQPPVITLLPGYSNTICLNSSISMTASGGFNNTYTWQPGGIIANVATLSPTTATTYTVYGTSAFGCIGKENFSIWVNPLPNVSCSSSPTATCPYDAATLTATGANSYTWFPFNAVSNTISVAPATTTQYTVMGTGGNGCTNSCVVTQSVHPPHTFPAVATPSAICVSNGGSGTSTLSTPGAPSTYTWYPGGTVSYSITTFVTYSLAPQVYTVVSTNSLGCVGENTIQVLQTDGFAAVNTPTSICTTTTLDLGNGVLLSPYPSGTIYLNGVPTGTLFSQPPGTYTIGYTNNNYQLCAQTATAAITVYSVPVTPTVVASQTFVCGGNNVTLTAIPSGYTYSWNPGGYQSNPYIFSPTMTTNYTAIAFNGDCSTPAGNEVIINHSPLACDCFTNCSTALSGTISSNPSSNQAYCVSTNLYFSGNVTLTNCDLKIAPNLTLVVLPNSTLTIAGSHLYACDAMWQGIVVKQGGKLNIVASGTTTSFIEDAFVAVELEATSTYSNTGILTATDVTFNKNKVSIRINEYQPNQTTYPFVIQNCLFTSRAISYSFQNYPATNTIKNSASGNSSTLQAQYINNSTYPLAVLKSPVATEPNTGIVLNFVGYTSSTANIYRNIVIGNAAATSSFNCFDNLREDIYAYNSNVTLSNNVFQNGVRVGTTAGGTAIKALSEYTGIDAKGINNNQILITIVGTNTALNNRFYEKTACADITGYLSTTVKNTQGYSYSNSSSNLNFSNSIGNRGYNIKTNRYQNITLEGNDLRNIKNAMMIGLESGLFAVGSQGGSGKLVGNIIAQNNQINGHPTSTTSTEFCNIGLSVEDLFPAATTSIISPGSSSSLIQNNRMQFVHNGISVSNIGFSGVSIVTNTITMVNEPYLFVQPTQMGIYAAQLLSTSTINQNSVTGPAAYSSDIKAISTSANALMAVRCNSTAYTARGLEFNGIQTISMLEDNTMSNQTYGLVLDNSAKLTSTVSTYVMGTASRPTNNRWLNTWSVPNYKTGTFNSSSAQDGKLYVQYGNVTLDPDGSGLTDGTNGVHNYFHSGGGSVTLLNVTTTVNPSCRISSGGGGGSGRMMSEYDEENIIALLEQTSTDSIVFDGTSAEAAFINKNIVYRTLQANPDLKQGSFALENFYSGSQSTSLETMVNIETLLASNDIATAEPMIGSLSPQNLVEENYKLFYEMYLRTKDGSFSATDSLNLINLANSCPYYAGAVVHQARALANIMANNYKVYNDNCGLIIGRTAKKKENLQVILKSQIFPNPSNGNFTIKFNTQLERESIEICILDLTGKILTRETRIMNDQNLSLSSHLEYGSYLVQVKFSDGTKDTHKLIISK